MINGKKVTAIIPARMGSSRFPGKPLQKILGLSMIEHVRRRVEEVKFLDEVYVATCDLEIKEEVETFGGKVMMTLPTHERCTDRIEEAARKLTTDIVVNVQGDEPMISQQALEEVVNPFAQNSEVLTSCLVYPITDLAELTSNNIVKAVLSSTKRILYLSRSAIPGREVYASTVYFKQSGIMAFRKSFLHKFNDLPPTPLEAKESIDMLRVLENDFWIQGVISANESKGVDIPEQVAMIEKAILNDPEQRQVFERISQRV
jgi:3-deoxy-manno-octulosonate cytidylyltransferase (CMP-KDO synthetase)